MTPPSQSPASAPPKRWALLALLGLGALSLVLARALAPRETPAPAPAASAAPSLAASASPTPSATATSSASNQATAETQNLIDEVLGSGRKKGYVYAPLDSATPVDPPAPTRPAREGQ